MFTCFGFFRLEMLSLKCWNFVYFKTKMCYRLLLSMVYNYVRLLTQESIFGISQKNIISFQFDYFKPNSY